MTDEPGEVFVVVTAPSGWGQTRGIDMLESRAMNREVGFSFDGWTVAARCATRSEADAARSEARGKNLSTMVLVFCGEGASP